MIDELPRLVGDEIVRVEDYHLVTKEYVEYFEMTISNKLTGLKVVLDFTNEASSKF